MARVLFICKRRNFGYHHGVPYGLLNSARFVAEAISELGHETKVVDVVDGNSVDREVYQYKPTHVIVEALWVTPEKIEELLKRYPKVKWSIRVHSKAPFIAMEGIALEWLVKYRDVASRHTNLTIAANSPEFYGELEALEFPAVYLPNIYLPKEWDKSLKDVPQDVLKVGCFGAIRPMKNHLQQAMAAMIFADRNDKRLEFHINSDRVEQRGEQVLKNLQALFANHPRHKLIEHPWLKHDEFLKLVREMDLGMQVSLTETFNIVTADFISQNIPVVVSPDITWVPWFFSADPNKPEDIVWKMRVALWSARWGLHFVNRFALMHYGRKALTIWDGYLSC